MLIVSLLTLSKVKAQEAALDEAETIKVTTQLVRVSVAVPDRHDAVRWEVRDNSHLQSEVVVDGTDNPLGLVIVIDLAEDHSPAWKYFQVEEELKRLPSRLHLKTSPRVYVSSPAESRFQFKWPKSWPTAYHANTGLALGAALNNIERINEARRALLIITNRVQELPPHAFEDLDARLAHTAAFIYLMAVGPQSAKTVARPIARSNLNADRVQAAPDKFIISEFGHFTRVANSLHVITYRPAGSNDGVNVVSAAHAWPQDHQIEVKAFDRTSNVLLVTQRREFRPSQ